MPQPLKVPVVKRRERSKESLSLENQILEIAHALHEIRKSRLAYDNVVEQLIRSAKQATTINDLAIVRQLAGDLEQRKKHLTYLEQQFRAKYGNNANRPEALLPVEIGFSQRR